MTRQQQLDEQKPCLFISLTLSLTPTTSSSSSSSILTSLYLSLSEIPMDVTLSSNPQTLTLVSCTPFSSSSSSKLRSIRREFLGSTQTLRPLRSRTNHRRTKLGLLQFQSPRFLIRASLHSRSVLVLVAVVTFSAVSVFFLNRCRRKNNDSEVSGPPDFVLSELGQDVMNWVFEGLNVGFREQHKEEESKGLKDKIRENGHASGDEEAPLIVQTSALIHEEALVTKPIQPPGSDVLTSSANMSLHSDEPEVSGQTFSPSDFESGVLNPLTLGKETTVLQVEGSKEEIASDSELPTLLSKIKHSAASVNIYDPPAEVNEFNKPNDELGEEHESISYNAFLGVSGREKLYMFYETNNSVAKSTANPSILKSFSPRASLNNKYSSLMRNTALKGAESTTQVSLHSAEYFEGKVPVASYKEGLPHSRGDSGKGKGFPRDREMKHLPKKNYKIAPVFPQPNGMHVTDNSHPSEQLSAYNRLLKVGRLTECVKLLEDMERRGLLDMNKVYHVRFFEACKRKKAIKEAFRYTKLIPNPTLSTFNMLMSVCASSQDSEGAFQVLQLVQDAGLKVDCKLYTTLVSTCAKSGKVDAMFEVFHKMVNAGVEPNVHTYGALIDGCARAGQVAKAFGAYGIMRSKSKNWQKALDLYEDLKSMKIKQTVSTLNALITALCDGDQLQKAVEVLSDMKGLGLSPNSITYSILLVASDKKDDLEAGLMLLSQAKKDGICPNIVMCRCIIGMCLRRFEEACARGEPVLSFDSRRPLLDNKWTSEALMAYRDILVAGVMPTIEVLSQVLGCLQLPYDVSLKNRLIENLGVSVNISGCSNLCSLIDGFGEYDPRAFSLIEEAASLGIVPCVSFKESPIVVDARNLQTHTAQVYLLTVLKGLKHRLAAGSKLPNINILLPVEKTQFLTPKGEKTINLAGRVSQAITALLRRLGIQYQGNESYGKIRINGLTLRRWFQPKLDSPFSGKPGDWSSSQSRLGKEIIHQQRDIRTGDLSLD
ncbi:pentatricopeptide repeat-containing protein MRL1, chloroplastic isoform X2 [Castanea sativa]|uniref:pentatricopeptide repeat-containing protein MRL1, chloroplastic isoform X2 n=1 Tax=Castanea sativa TaxID=21020 RepID=UPI003F651C24